LLVVVVGVMDEWRWEVKGVEAYFYLSNLHLASTAYLHRSRNVSHHQNIA
jgi:hypothetical protein